MLSTGTNSNGEAAVASSDWDDKIRLGTLELLYEMRVRFSVASASAGSCIGIFGLSNLDWNSATDIYFSSTSTAGVFFLILLQDWLVHVKAVHQPQQLVH